MTNDTAAQNETEMNQTHEIPDQEELVLTDLQNKTENFPDQGQQAVSVTALKNNNFRDSFPDQELYFDASLELRIHRPGAIWAIFTNKQDPSRTV